MASKVPPKPETADSPPGKAKKSSADYQREFRQRMREQGLQKKEVWIRPENARLLNVMEKQLREASYGAMLSDELDWQAKLASFTDRDRLPKSAGRALIESDSNPEGLKTILGEDSFGEDSLGRDSAIEEGGNLRAAWTPKTLFESIKKVEPFKNGLASVEFIGGAAPALHVIMHDYGDLPVFVTVVGEQILVESVLWALDDVEDPALFNDAILRSHKYFPLSTISLDSVGGGLDYYYMFGALSSTSILSNIIFEIEVLAFNVIQAAEAYSEFLAEPLNAS